MKITKSDESTLVLAITEVLNEAEVVHYGFLRLPTDWEKPFKSSIEKDFCAKLYNCLDDGGLSSLIQREVLSQIYAQAVKLPEDGKSVKLTSYRQFSDPLKIAKILVEIIKSLPRQYEVVVRVCNALSELYSHPITPVKIYDRMYITSGSNLSGHFPTHHQNEKIDSLFRSYNARDIELREINENALYLVYRTSGYMSDRNSPRPFSDFYDDIRAFYGAAITFGIFHRFTGGVYSSPVAFIANEIDGQSRRFVYREAAEKDIVEASRLYTTKETDDKTKTGSSIVEVFDPIIRLFNSPEARRLKTASIWLLRAYQAQRGMDQILDSTIAIEVLLGDREASDRVGLSKLMANRCAYSLGKTSQDRKEIHDFFINFYKVRSDIVHSGRLKLMDGERNVVREGINLAGKILIHETDLSTAGN